MDIDLADLERMELEYRAALKRMGLGPHELQALQHLGPEQIEELSKLLGQNARVRPELDGLRQKVWMYAWAHHELELKRHAKPWNRFRIVAQVITTLFARRSPGVASVAKPVGGTWLRVLQYVLPKKLYQQIKQTVGNAREERWEAFDEGRPDLARSIHIRMHVTLVWTLIVLLISSVLKPFADAKKYLSGD